MMSKIGLFVKEARKWLKLTEPVVVVVGNESCDLDSAVCAVSLAYFYMNTNNLPAHLQLGDTRRFLPLMNIHRTNLPLKTEVTYFMRANGIDVDDLVCSNELPSELLSISKFILVDHHVATRLVNNEQSIQIFDHRPLDTKNAHIPSTCKLRLEEVGSCATLIADEVRVLEGSFDNQSDVLRLLRGAIVLDTINFSESAGKVKPLDIEINDEIEKSLGLKEEDRLKIFTDLVDARRDVSSLSALQLLSKDLKIISSNDKSKVVAIPGFPILVENFMEKPDVWNSLQHFGSARDCDFLVLMGMKELVTGGIRRDFALIPLRNPNLGNEIMNKLSVENGEYLQLEEKSNTLLSSVNGRLFEQKNVKASRKQILPIIRSVLDHC